MSDRQPYTKLPLTVEAQADLLIARGMSGEREKLVQVLKTINYYRLSGYLWVFRKDNGVDFVDGTNIDDLWRLYTFDRRLRCLLFECISRIEVALRTRIIQEHSLATNDPFCYVSRTNFDAENERIDERHEDLLKRISQSIKKASEPAFSCVFLQHFQETYTNPFPPVWMAMEVVDFGVVQHYYRLLPKPIRINIAKEFGITDKTLVSLLILLNRMRNACAHHDRIVLKRFPTKGLKRYLDSKKNRRLDALSQAIETEDDEAGISLYFVASIMVYMLTCLRPESSWKQRFISFLISDENAYARSLLETFNKTLWTTYRLWQ